VLRRKLRCRVPGQDTELMPGVGIEIESKADFNLNTQAAEAVNEMVEFRFVLAPAGIFWFCLLTS
jgi:hypothetical protein